MSWDLKEKEIEAVLGSDARHRYEYFIHRVCETRQVWGLYQDGWASVADGEKTMIPFWPHARYAERFAVGAWRGYVPGALDIGEFLDPWIPEMRGHGVEPAIFPNRAGSAVMIPLADLESHLRRELAEYYGED